MSGIKFNLYLDAIVEDTLVESLDYIHNGDRLLNEEFNIYGIESENIFDELYDMSEKFEKNKEIKIYQSNNGVDTFVNEYDFGGLQVYFNEVMECFFISDSNYKYLVLRKNTKEKNRQLLRIMKEVTIRTYENKGGVIFHAGAVMLQNKGIIISGPKGAGKTTLLCHILNKMNIDYIANDRIIITDELDIVYLPLSMRIGVGTFNNMSKVREYVKTMKLSRMQMKGLNGNSEAIFKGALKYEIVSKELEKIFSCNLKDCANLRLVVMPNIILNKNIIEVEELGDAEKRKLLAENMLSPNDDMWLNPWIEKRTLSDGELDEVRITMLNKIIDNVKVIKLSYGTQNSSDEILDILQSVINEIK
ncbi:GTP-binding protein [Bacillus sp. SRB_331]|uniref:GTP-binding protein n=1 Tax=Bacillus sp. SRB_331 TaxID=1969379 RepID=UPI000DC5B9A9|nr:GTP-binding protein [Bacillus sp. SRB_331]RAN76606.1 hypothetical protein B5P42_23045 [Bacillus sp. SRB_331]